MFFPTEEVGRRTGGGEGLPLHPRSRLSAGQLGPL